MITAIAKTDGESHGGKKWWWWWWWWLGETSHYKTNFINKNMLRSETIVQQKV